MGSRSVMVSAYATSDPAPEPRPGPTGMSWALAHLMKSDTIGLGDQCAAGNTQQRVVSFVVVGAGEIRLVGRNQRQALGVGEIDQARFDAALLVDAVTLQLDIEAIAEQIGEPVASHSCQC